jgi:hypothetical protein
VWFDLPQGLADPAAAVPAVMVIYTTEAASGLPDQLPIAPAAPIVREYNEQLAEAPAK